MPEWLKNLVSKVSTKAKEIVSPKAMEFKIGEGLTQEQAVKAKEVISRQGEYAVGAEPQLTTKQALEIFGGKIREEVVKGRGEVPVSNIPPELSKEAFAKLGTEVMGFALPFGKEKKAVVPKVETAVSRITDVLKKAKPIRATQEKLYTAERALRFAKGEAVGKEIGGEAGFYAEKSQFKGELPKVKFESIRNKINQTDVDDLFQQVKTNPWLRYTDTLTAREGLVNMIEGRVPTESQLEMLNKVFPKDFLEAMQGNRNLWDKIYKGTEEILNIPRSVMSSFDFSFGGRQGIFAAPTYRKEFFNSWIKQFKLFGSDKAYQETMQTITKNPYFNLAKESGVSFTNVGQVMSQREEKFLSTWAEKIPLVKASGRAYTGFANKFRMDIFSSMIKDLETSGIKVTKPMAEQAANLVNVATGRGGLGKFAPAANILNAFFYSPRLMSSRIQLLTNPKIYFTAEAPIRKEAWKMLFGFAGYVGSVLTLAKLAGAEIGINPKSADFGKIKIGDTRIDITGGFGQYIRSFVQLSTGEYVSSVTGKKYTLGEGYKSMTRRDIALRLIEAKEAPIASFITDLMQGTTITGEKVKPIPKELSVEAFMKSEIGQRLIPMVAGDIYDLAKEDPNLLPLGVLGIFGFGLQTYEQRMNFKSTSNPWDKQLRKDKNPWD